MNAADADQTMRAPFRCVMSRVEAMYLSGAVATQGAPRDRCATSLQTARQSFQPWQYVGRA
eukprot:8333619-Lingulodinium_polyedra.AAC.1